MRRAPLLLACVLLLPCCSPQPFDAKAEGEKLLQRDKQWADTASAGRDVDKTLSYWSDDALLVPQGQPIAEGKAAIRAFVASSFATPGFHIQWKSEKPVFSPDGNFAWLRSTTMTTAPGPGGKLATFASRGITVWRRDGGGEWRCVVDIWNDPPAAAPQ